ncbi:MULTISPECIES: hypothetical protein [Nocardiaceae]|uniref:hypothetical protein n=1 Tax=Nocardiaceae TaxID=85025 RepID=UPI00085A8C94|nr:MULTISPECIES: hypothetical protein [Rhodococcus]
MAAEYDADIIDGVRRRKKTDHLKAEMADVDRQLAARRSGSALGETAAADNSAEAFEAASLMGQRAIIDAHCEVRLRPGTRGSRTYRPETVKVVWRGLSAGYRRGFTIRPLLCRRGQRKQPRSGICRAVRAA